MDMYEIWSKLFCLYFSNGREHSQWTTVTLTQIPIIWWFRECVWNRLLRDGWTVVLKNVGRRINFTPLRFTLHLTAPSPPKKTPIAKDFKRSGLQVPEVPTRSCHHSHASMNDQYITSISSRNRANKPQPWTVVLSPCTRRSTPQKYFYFLLLHNKYLPTRRWPYEFYGRQDLTSIWYWLSA